MVPVPQHKKLGGGGSDGGIKYLLLGLGHQSKLAHVLEGSPCGNGGIWCELGLTTCVLCVFIIRKGLCASAL